MDASDVAELGVLQTISPNRDIKVYLGAPGSRASAGSGYVPIDELKSISQTMRKAFPSFGGVMCMSTHIVYSCYLHTF